jgi:ABC-type Zn2+ transport system substrate-binding protein/surface adhesin
MYWVFLSQEQAVIGRLSSAVMLLATQQNSKEEKMTQEDKTKTPKEAKRKRKEKQEGKLSDHDNDLHSTIDPKIAEKSTQHFSKGKINNIPNMTDLTAWNIAATASRSLECKTNWVTRTSASLRRASSLWRA